MRYFTKEESTVAQKGSSACRKTHSSQWRSRLHRRLPGSRDCTLNHREYHPCLISSLSQCWGRQRRGEPLLERRVYLTLPNRTTEAIVTGKSRSFVRVAYREPIASRTRFLQAFSQLSTCALVSLLWLVLGVPQGRAGLGASGA